MKTDLLMPNVPLPPMTREQELALKKSLKKHQPRRRAPSVAARAAELAKREPAQDRW